MSAAPVHTQSAAQLLYVLKSANYTQAEKKAARTELERRRKAALDSGGRNFLHG